MLILPIKKQWYDLILSGEKKEEYREIKPYYETRFKHCGLLDSFGNPTGARLIVAFRNGYSAKSPTFCAKVKCEIKTGNPAWGAMEGEKYYALQIEDILR